MKLKDVTPRSVSRVERVELVNMHYRTHQLFAGAKKRNAHSKYKQQIIKAHNILAEEMVSRGINHKSPIIEGIAWMESYNTISELIVV